MASQSPPYRPTEQALGGTPTVLPDVPVSAVFMLLYFLIGVRHQLLFIRNKKAGRKFLFCGMMAGLCWIRVITGVLRIVWAVYPTNIRVGIAAAVFVNVGTVILYFVDLFFAQRIVRAQHPRFGWGKIFSPIVPATCVVTVLTVIMVIVVSIQSFYTLSNNTRRIDHDVQLYVETAFSVISFLPFVIVSISTLVRQIPTIKRSQTEDKFGTGSLRAKIFMVCGASILLAGADATKAGTAYLPPVPIYVPGSNPPVPADTPWYFSRGVFFGLGLAPEIIVLFMYAILRVDRRFYIPDGAKRPYSYAGGFTFAGEPGNEKAVAGNHDSLRNLVGSTASVAAPSTTRSGRTSNSGTRDDAISWGGIPYDVFNLGYGLPASERNLPAKAEGNNEFTLPQEFEGADQEMGWNTRNGRWELRPVSLYNESVTMASTPKEGATSNSSVHNAV